MFLISCKNSFALLRGWKIRCELCPLHNKRGWLLSCTLGCNNLAYERDKVYNAWLRGLLLSNYSYYFTTKESAIRNKGPRSAIVLCMSIT